ncbi:hypothetical protein AAVH_29449 [Aphelenchoides avenae]|nr:hypothetical protein AAVH_29449 [Aphelenchus avenae]
MNTSSPWSRRADASSRTDSRASSDASINSSVQVLSGRSASFTVRDDASMASPLDLRYLDAAFGNALRSPIVPDEDALMAEVSNVSSILFAANQSHLSRILMGSPSPAPQPAPQAEPAYDPSLPTHTVACEGPTFIASPHVGPPHAIVPVPPAIPSPSPFFYNNVDWQLADWFLCANLGVPIEQREHVMVYRPACCTSVLHGRAVWSELQAKLNYVSQVVCLTPETYKSVTGTTFTSYLRDGLNYPLKMKDMPLVRLWDGFLAPLESLLVHLVPPCSALF